ncbi:MAG: Rrf2 family transcriptional regulator [Hydrogenophilaceae bacterium]|jgi:Rrf2 family iron-sulfur cluster assembly transcriptional regulator|nr:Rrf2 family transcriptional regulator [Hydrogenophilaceae bacterium]
MRLTSKGRYAVMAMADLAKNGGSGRAVPLQDIAERQQISLSYLEQLFARLRRAGLVTGMRGPGGGYRLARTPADLAVAEIVLAVNEPIKATRCKEGSPKGCMGVDGRCIAHDLWEELGQHIHGFLAAVSLEDVIERRVRRTAIAAE